MDDLLNHLDFWLMVATLVMAAYYFIWKDRLEPGVRWLAHALQGVVHHDPALVQVGPAPASARAPRRPLPIRARRVQPRGLKGRWASPRTIETERNGAEARFNAVSGATKPSEEAEMIAFRFLARLIKAGYVTETQALECACEVKAGSSKAYQEARAKLKRALGVVELEREVQPRQTEAQAQPAT